MFSVPTTDQRRGGAESAGEGQGPEGGKEGEKKKKKKDSIASRPRGRGEAGGVGSAAAEATGATRSSEARPVRPTRRRPDPQGREAGGGARGWGAGGFMGTGRQCGETRTFRTGWDGTAT